MTGLRVQTGAGSGGIGTTNPYNPEGTNFVDDPAQINNSAELLRELDNFDAEWWIENFTYKQITPSIVN
mgnify:CR=1 FL=1